MKPELPKFPTMLRKMWSGTEVQQWIDENIAPLFDQAVGPVKVRKAFICPSCEGVYADQPVSQCDCMPERDEFIEGTISYPSAEPVAAPNPIRVIEGLFRSNEKRNTDQPGFQHTEGWNAALMRAMDVIRANTPLPDAAAPAEPVQSCTHKWGIEFSTHNHEPARTVCVKCGYKPNTSALLAKHSEQPSKCSEVVGYTAEDMADQGAQGFRHGYAAALDEALKALEPLYARAMAGRIQGDDLEPHDESYNIGQLGQAHGISQAQTAIMALKSDRQQT